MPVSSASYSESSPLGTSVKLGFMERKLLTNRLRRSLVVHRIDHVLSINRILGIHHVLNVVDHILRIDHVLSVNHVLRVDHILDVGRIVENGVDVSYGRVPTTTLTRLNKNASCSAIRHSYAEIGAAIGGRFSVTVCRAGRQTGVSTDAYRVSQTRTGKFL